MIGYLVGNGLWTLANAWPHERYRRALRDPRRAQERLLFDFLKRNAESAYGRKYAYATIRSVRQFQEQVPIVAYDDLEPWIARICNGEPGVLTAEPVVAMEKTSGSSGAVKFIPYTRSLLREFQEAIGAWMFDLFRSRPALLAGAQYWSISPSARQKEFTPGGLPVGFDDDTEYLGSLARRLVRAVMAVPGELCRVPDIEENRRQTLEHLLRCRNLRFISVWNPSFLTLLMERLPTGTRPADFWPELQLISCWTSGAAARFLPELTGLFPGVAIQGKGLLATEAVVSFPRAGLPAPAPALTSHFLEFLDADGTPRLVDELVPGRRYRVVVTTGGGLARYDLGDVVEAIAPHAIEFVGRDGCVSDVCGEKLSDVFVGAILTEEAARLGLSGFVMLAPDWSRPPRYLVFAESVQAPALAGAIEKRLRASVHYDYCRRLGQLAAVEGVVVSGAAERYLHACESLGQRPGSVKPAYLRREFGWRERLESAGAI